jgi:hypothetical protein
VRSNGAFQIQPDGNPRAVVARVCASQYTGPPNSFDELIESMMFLYFIQQS